MALCEALGGIARRLQSIYEKGVNAYQSGGYERAFKLFTDATNQGDTDALYPLGYMYNNGQGVIQDDKKAFELFTLAAEQGNASAQGNLGIMYFNGQGVLQDNVYSYMWLNIAASNWNSDASNNKDIVAKEMTSEQIAQAQKLARECVAKDYKGC